MVHALNEIHRVLADHGSLIDLRPMLDRWPLEVTSKGKNLEAGKATDLEGPLADDGAANLAMEGALQRGLFVRKSQDIFPFFYYWDTPKEMQEYLDESWNDVITVEENVWGDLRSLWATSNADARVRIKLKMMITSLHK